MEESYLEEIVGDFVTHVRNSDFDSEGNLGEHFDSWVEAGNAIKQTAGDYTVFLRAWLFVLMRFAEDPDLFGPDRVSPVVHLRGSELPMFLHQENWNLYVFRYKYGNRVQ